MQHKFVKGERFYKKERLCSKNDIDRLFASRAGGSANSRRQPVEPPFSAVAYPWRAVWLASTAEGVDFPRLLIMVPKRRLRHAVDRVAMRRKLREAYRRMRASLPQPDKGVDVAFIYVADTVTPVYRSERSVKKIFDIITKSLSANDTPCAENPAQVAD